VSACKECKHRTYKDSILEGTHYCEASPKKVWDAVEGTNIIVGYKWCSEVNTGNGDCSYFEQRLSKFEWFWKFMRRFKGERFASRNQNSG